MSSASLKRSWSLTIGQRLTLWAAGIALTICLLVCAILYTGLAISLQHEVDAFLEGEVNEFMAMLDPHADDYQVVEEEIRHELGNRARRDLDFRLLDESGGVVVTSEVIDRATGFWLPPKRAALSENGNCFHTLQVPGASAPVRVCSRKFIGRNGQVFIAQASYRQDEMIASLARFSRICAVALVFGGLACLLGGRVIASRSLRPVKAMTVKAQQISERRLDDRLPCRGTNDELDHLAETLNDMLDRVRDYVRRMQQFTADASHELRSPLAALRGNAEVILTRPRSAEELRRTIEESVDHYTRLSRIAEDLLLLARLDAGEAVLRPERLRLDAALAGIVDLYTPLANDAGIELALAQHEGITLYADGGRIRQLVGNLVDNAIKFTSPPGRVEVSLTHIGGQARIAVKDTGMGIPPSEQARIFDRFYRVDKARSGAVVRGAGLGLAICRSIVEAHGGRIEVESTLGAGTTMIVFLPIAEPPAEPVA
jgi:heavy metal sensor kinase